MRRLGGLLGFELGIRERYSLQRFPVDMKRGEPGVSPLAYRVGLGSLSATKGIISVK